MQHNLEATLAKLVSIPSVTSNSAACHEVLEFVRTELADLGLFIYSDTNRTNPWMVATTQNTKTPDILLAAHLDVVPGADALFTMTEQDGKLHGRGVYDMKFAASCFIELLKTHASDLPHLNIGVLFTTDEEFDSSNMNAVFDWGLRPGMVLLPDGGDDWAVEQRAKGIYVFELTAHGKTAHGSRPWEGDNALHALLDVAQTLRLQFPSANPGDPTLSINKIHSGEVLNQVPHHAIVAGDFRSFNKQDLADCQLLVNELANLRRLHVRIVSTGDPVIFDSADNLDVQRFLHLLPQTTGESEVRYGESYGASDARFFAQYDIPCIVIEPHGGGRHSHGEWILASDLEKFYQLTERWIFDPAA